MSYDIWLTIDTGGPEPAIVHDLAEAGGEYLVRVDEEQP